MAPYIPEDTIAEIKRSADILEIVSEVVVLKPAGRNYVGLCPFHTEKTPSFTVSPEKQIFYCFGCGAGGNMFSFLMKHEGLSFPEAVQQLARRYGVRIPETPLNPRQRRRAGEKELLLEINRRAMDFYHRCLKDSEAGRAARSYLAQRDMNDHIVDSFSIGFAPPGWSRIVDLFSKHGTDLKAVEKSGLIVARRERSGYYDRFRNRIMFPICDARRRCVGFGGRVMDDSLPKYLNSPETPVYNKSRSLYGQDQARRSCRESASVHIVEGYFDLLALHQFGVTNAVATLGTALSNPHARMLRGLVGAEGAAVLVYDSDTAGLKAARRSIDVFAAEHLEARIMVLPSGHDPDSYLFEFGLEAFKTEAGRALEAVSFMMHAAVEQHGLSKAGKLRIMRELGPALAGVKDPLARALHIRELAERLAVPETVVADKVRSTPPSPGSPNAGRQPQAQAAAASAGAVEDRGSRIERQLVAMMLQVPAVRPEVVRRKLLDRFESRTLRSIGALALEAGRNGPVGVEEILEGMPDEGMRRRAASLAIGDEAWDMAGCRRLIRQYEDCRRKEDNDLLAKIRAAEASHDDELLARLLKARQTQARSRNE